MPLHHTPYLYAIVTCSFSLLRISILHIPFSIRYELSCLVICLRFMASVDAALNVSMMGSNVLEGCTSCRSNGTREGRLHNGLSLGPHEGCKDAGYLDAYQL